VGFLSPTEELIEEARQGRMFVLVDDEDRENEGDLVIPAQFCDAAAVNFMAKHGRGLICLALTRRRCELLGLPLMGQGDESRITTAFTVSIEAREGGDDRHLRRRPGAHGRGRDRPGRHPRRPGEPRPRLPADGAGRRRAGPHRPHRGRRSTSPGSPASTPRA
jgi:3,4-dihydroxy 2-butanone 4-phosphate synthase/GTP cyclohydrolase II